MTQPILNIQALLALGAQHLSQGSRQRGWSMLAPAMSTQPRHGVELDCESVAGEEDPGASLDLPVASQSRPADGTVNPAPLNPGDEAPAGTPGTGESICRECGGSGLVAGAKCSACGGTGKVTVGVGGA